MPPSAEGARLGVGIPTCGRPHRLDSLLDSLAAQRGNIPAFAVIVVDNDAHGSAREIAARYRAKFAKLIYEIEAKRGYATVRNKIFEIAGRENLEFLALIDDDETANEDWLEKLVEAQTRYVADVVGGPVPAVYHDQTPCWVRQGGFLERSRGKTGEQVRLVLTGNCLVRLEAIRGIQPPFDVDFDRDSGEDTLLSRQLSNAGARMVWCDEAVAWETIPPERATVRYLMSRAIRGGRSYALVERKLGATRIEEIGRAVKGAIHVGSVPLRLLLAIFARGGWRAGIARAFVEGALGVGMIQTVFGSGVARRPR